MKKVFLLLVINFFVAGYVAAGDETFSVLLNKGDNQYGKSNAFKSVLIGTSIEQDEILKIVDGGYMALVHESSGASVELTKKGEYSAKTLEEDLMKQSSSVLAKYGKFLMEKLNPEEDGTQNLNVTGAVERGENGLIEVRLPKVVDIYGLKAYISWQKIDDIEDYIVTYKDKLDEVTSTRHG